MRASACNASRSLAVTAILFLLVCAGCAAGGGDSKPAVVPLTAAQATAVASQVNESFIAATAGIGSNLCPTIGLKIGQTAFCAIDVAKVVPCTGGGRISITGSATGDMDFTDSGGTLASLSLVPAACAVAETDLTITGAPDLTIAGNVNFFYGGIEYVNVAETGSVDYGPSPAGACPVNLTATASFYGNAGHTARSCQVTGTACGQAVNLTCM